ncbi:MAG TPA: AMP-binding protein [Planctomycetota bacterium]|jgi:long-subunit acyl-CoA synthetase (AMP-forming)|nr:AMP-binding protein [Planctomycetota bacterium]
MSVLSRLLESLPRWNLSLETYGRSGQLVRRLSGQELEACIREFREQFDGWDAAGRRAVALLFKSEETAEFLVAAFAAISMGYTVVPLYPNWSAETQLEYIRAYRLRAVCTGAGFRSRAETWLLERDSPVDRYLPLDLAELLEQATRRPEGAAPLRLDAGPDHPCAWIFTSGTSGKLAKLTEITLRNLDAAVENIQELDFLFPGMTIHCPLSASHVFAFVAILGFLSTKPKRVIFSDIQYLQRLPQSATGKVDGIVLVPIVIHRLRSGFYEKLVARLDPKEVPPELKTLARIPLPARKLLKRVVLRAEAAAADLERTGRTHRAGWAAIVLARKLFSQTILQRLGSPSFVVVGGAKPSLQAMAFLEVMGIRCLQGWGMTETTGPLAVCTLGDRFRGAFGTCGTLFRETNAYIEDGELIVEGPQIARGYHQPDGSFVPFHGRKRTGDQAEFDRSGRLRVIGKASDRITTCNGINYDPIPFEEELYALDLQSRHLVEEIVVIGDAQPRLGAVFFLREGVDLTDSVRGYLATLVREVNLPRPVDEKIGPWTISARAFKEAGVLGPSGKLVRSRVEMAFARIFDEAVAVGN